LYFWWLFAKANIEGIWENVSIFYC